VATELLVLHSGTHGIPTTEYVAALRERLPDRTVRLARTPSEERAAITDAELVTGLSIDEALLSRAEALAVFACAYAGTDHLPLEQLRARDVTVTNASGVHGPNVAEHVVGSILTFVRRFREGWHRQTRREWRHYQTGELAGSTVTIVGLGAIGTTVADRLAAFDVETVGVRYAPEKGGPTDQVIGFEDRAAFEAALADSDSLVLACPLTETTRGLIGPEELDTLPPDAILVNVARGPVVETDALVGALRSNRLRGAALDVTDPEPLPGDHPLWRFENVQLTPHNAGHTPNYYDRLADIVAENCRRYDREEALQNVVNAPEQ
jgi:phosphoglycerate dehydrogenase-like enzyme